MKISESMIRMQADHQEETTDVIMEASRTVRSLAARNLSPGIWTDRVSISAGLVRETESGYQAGMQTRSRVLDTRSGEAVQFRGDSLSQGLIQGVLGRNVTVRISETWDAAVRPQGQSLSQNTLATVHRTRVQTESESLAFAARGQVLTEDGRAIDFSLDFSLDRSLVTRTEEDSLIRTWQAQAGLIDPLVISLDGKPPELTDKRFEFDLDSDGVTEEVSFVSGGSGFLAFDRNQDGEINDGSELFGPGTGNGFTELAAYDSDGNGWIDENDDVFSQLSVWTRDGQGNDQLLSLKAAGLGAISLHHVGTGFDYTDDTGGLKGQMRQSGVFLFENGNVGSIHQVDLAVRPETAETDEKTSVIPAAEPFRVWETLPAPALFRQSGAVRENPLRNLMDEIEKLREQLMEILDGRRAKAEPRRILAIGRSPDNVSSRLLGRI